MTLSTYIMTEQVCDYREWFCYVNICIFAYSLQHNNGNDPCSVVVSYNNHHALKAIYHIIVGNFGEVFTLGACARVAVVCLCVCVCVCLSVCYHASCFIPHLYFENTVPLSFLWRSQDMHCVNFVEIALYKSSGDICWSPAFFASSDKLSVNKRQRWLLFKKNSE